MQAALDVKAGSWLAAITWGGLFAFFKQGVSIDGRLHILPFAQNVIIPIEPGFHAIEFFMKSPLYSAPHLRQMLHEVKVNVDRGFVQPLTYRMHRTTIGPLFNFKLTVLKQLPPIPLQAVMVGGYGQMPQVNPQRHASVQDHYDADPTPRTPPRQKKTSKFCVSCGAIMSTGTRFCGECGQAVGT